MKDIKAFQLRIPKEHWIFLKKKGIDRELSLNAIIVELIESYKNKCGKKYSIKNTLTSRDTVVP